MKIRKFKQRKHMIKESLLDKWHLNVMQKAKVYSFKTKKEQEKQAKSYKASIKHQRLIKFATTGLGRHVLNKKQQKLTDYARTLDAKTQRKELIKVRRELTKIETIIDRARIQQTKIPMNKEDLIEALRYKIFKERAAINEIRHNQDVKIYIKRTRKESYEENETTNISFETWLFREYASLYDELMSNGMQDKEGKWVVPIGDERKVKEEIIKQALEDGKIEKLAQGEGYGYITDDYKEVISPV